MKKVESLITRHEDFIIFFLVVVLLLLSGILVVMSGDRLRYTDEQDYNQLAQSLVSGQGFTDAEGQPTAFRPPGWPFVLSAIYSVFPYPLAAKLFNSVMLACTAYLLSLLVARILPTGKVIAPLLVLLYPVGLYTATTLYPQTFGGFLLVTIFILLTGPSVRTMHSCLAGILLGVLFLSIPAFLLITPLALAGLFLICRKEQLVFIRHAAIVLICAALIFFTWTLRNACVLGSFIPVSTNSGVNLLRGNSENSAPNSGVNVDIFRYQLETEKMNEVARDKQFKRFAVDWMIRNPCAAFRLYLLKVVNYFNFRNELATKGERSCLRDTILFCSYYPLLLIAIIRIIAYRKRYPMSPVETMLYIIYFGNAFTSAIFFTRIRFRVPFDALLIVIAAAFLGFLLRSSASYAVIEKG